MQEFSFQMMLLLCGRNYQLESLLLIRAKIMNHQFLNTVNLQSSLTKNKASKSVLGLIFNPA